MIADLGNKQRVIEEYEFSFARRLGKQVIEKPKISVWLVLLPILFVHYAQRIRQYKSGLQQFCDGLLHARKFALAAEVADLLGGGEVPDYRESFLKAHPDPSDDVREVLRHQLAEIAFLRPHYRLLLTQAKVDDYGVMIRRAYSSEADYRRFLEDLEQIEEQVRQAVLQAFQPGREAAEVGERMARWGRELREEEVRFIYR